MTKVVVTINAVAKIPQKFDFLPVFRASWPLKLNYPKNQAFSSEKLAILGVPR